MALRYPIKKIAAAATLVVLFCYLMLSGAAIPTERAFVMNGLVFAAILIDRLRISMRICALAAAFVLVIEPESLVGVSFQMSFGAVVALIAVYETYGRRLGHLLHRPSLPGRVLGYAGAVVVTTVVVTIGTDPFSIYHFHHIALYSPLANVVAVPLSAVWTLPWGVVACLLMPFGLERFALVPMGWGIDATILVAQNVSATPRQCLADAATAGGRGWCWSRSAGCGYACGSGRGDAGAWSRSPPGLPAWAFVPAARCRDRRYRPFSRGALARRAVLGERRAWREDRRRLFSPKRPDST